MTDDVMKGLTQTITLGPAELDALIEQQINFFVQQEKMKPNCVLLGDCGYSNIRRSRKVT